MAETKTGEKKKKKREVGVLKKMVPERGKRVGDGTCHQGGPLGGKKKNAMPEPNVQKKRIVEYIIAGREL